jgi:hypothetical protein
VNDTRHQHGKGCIPKNHEYRNQNGIETETREKSSKGTKKRRYKDEGYEKQKKNHVKLYFC